MARHSLRTTRPKAPSSTCAITTSPASIPRRLHDLESSEFFFAKRKEVTVEELTFPAGTERGIAMQSFRTFAFFCTRNCPPGSRRIEDSSADARAVLRKADISTETAQFIGGGICELKRCHLRDETYASSLAQPSLLAHKARYLWFSLPPIRSMMPAASMRSCGLPTFSF